MKKFLILLAFLPTLALGQGQPSRQSFAAQNYIINGNFDFWQRGTSIASIGNAVYGADRWYQFSVVGATTSQVAATNSNSQYGLKVARNAGQTFTGGISIAQPLETANIRLLRGKIVTLSFWVKAGANFSAAGNLLTVRLLTGTGAEGKASGGSFTGPVNQIQVTPAITTTMTKYVYTATAAVPANATQMELYFQYAPVGTAGADDSFTIEQVMLNAGPTAAPFSLAGGDVQGELAKVQRYYEPIIAEQGFPCRTGGSDVTLILQPFTAVPMRIAPRIVPVSGVSVGAAGPTVARSCTWTSAGWPYYSGTKGRDSCSMSAGFGADKGGTCVFSSAGGFDAEL